MTPTTAAYTLLKVTFNARHIPPLSTVVYLQFFTHDMACHVNGQCSKPIRAAWPRNKSPMSSIAINDLPPFFLAFIWLAVTLYVIIALNLTFKKNYKHS